MIEHKTELRIQNWNYEIIYKPYRICTRTKTIQKMDWNSRQWQSRELQQIDSRMWTQQPIIPNRNRFPLEY